MLTTGATLKFEQHLFQILFYYFIVKELRKKFSEKSFNISGVSSHK